MIRLILAVVTVAGLGAVAWGYFAGRPFVGLCGLVALPAGMVLAVMSLPWFLREGRRD